MISIERGLEIVMSAVREKDQPGWMGPERVDLAASLGRVLREDVFSDSDSPAFDKSIRDGFAVRHDDVRDAPAVLAVIGESRAGAGAGVSIGPGQCCEIMTGAPLPGGANAVVMVEYTERTSADRVRILRPVRENEGVLRRGVEARKGDRILETGQYIGLADIGLLASAGKSMVAVSEKPRTAILATGDELVEIHQTPGAGQIRNSNSHTLYSQVVKAGAMPNLLGIARDNLEDLRPKIEAGLRHDLLLVSGGVSMGKYDLVENVFAEFGVEVLFDKIAMKPGKPTVFGRRDRTYVFGLPGNPVSTMVAFHMFVRPLIKFLLKANETAPEIYRAKLDTAAKCDPQRASLSPALARFVEGAYHIAAVPWKGSSDLVGLSRANALIMIPQQEGTLQPGDTAQFLFME
jgi:molybdopterin molybdotransferase